MANKVVIVLGMHKSGTSFVSRGISNEVNMGSNLFMGTRDNPKGHHEDKYFLELNRKILEEAGGDWRNLPSKERINEVGVKYFDKIKELLQERMKLECESFGWKDPRTLLLIDLYMKVIRELELEVFFIICFRDKKEVAKSLLRRNNIPLPEGLSLAEQYNSRLLNFLNKEIC